MGSAADELLELIYKWLEAAKDCGSNLRGLAEELVSLREGCCAAETVGSTVAVAGSVVAIGAAFFTGGASLALWGMGVMGGVGAGINLATKITERFMSSNKLNRVTEIDQNCRKISNEMQALFQRLREECPCSDPDQQEQYVVEEILKAISRRFGLGYYFCTDLSSVVYDIKENVLVLGVTTSLVCPLVGEVLAAFSLIRVVGSKGGAEVGKAVAIQGVARFLGGVVGLAFSLPEAIDNWKEAIKSNHETQASKSLNDTADQIDKVRNNLSDKLSQIKEFIETAAKKQQQPPKKTSFPSVNKMQTNDSESSLEYLDTCQPKMFRSSYRGDSDSSEQSDDDEEDSSSSSYEEVVVKMALLNVRSVNKLQRRGDNTITEMIQDNDLGVLLLTETWLPENRTESFRNTLPTGYDVFSRPRSDGRQGGGLALVFNSNEYECYPDPLDIDFDVNFEYQAALLSVPCALDGVLILNIYRPPKPYPKFFEELEKLLTAAFDQYGVVIMGGDFNIWVDCPKDSFSRKFHKFLQKKHLKQHVPESTHNKGHTLDLVLTRPNVKITDVKVEPNSISDHHTVFFNLHFTSQSAIRSERSVARRKAKEEMKKKQKRK
ncbi:unnamed protein product [Knipowitschia caucasica]